MEPSKEECVLDMGLRSNSAAAKYAQMEPYKEEFALGMELRRPHGNYAAGKDVQNKPKKEEFVSGMGETIFRREKDIMTQIFGSFGRYQREL